MVPDSSLKWVEEAWIIAVEGVVHKGLVASLFICRFLHSPLNHVTGLTLI